ncbi:hypothetical protein [Haloarchaeobius sp. HME9146]|uniref:hypothetical protein n=1 Tax=Haloarchaeobius sp. HME9146 TaxID=2978732 RepID=UPI0021BE292C|nr:hypothetical protein [Haloarchaeobius sp. HME9146]MCT9095285.1 hypothetical protein [Haloarchaeobius sp. HME9146]
MWGLEVAQSAMPTASVVVLAFLAGAACPAYYAQERLRGFGRTILSRLPYAPPPGMDAEQAMQQAVEAAETGTEGTQDE